MGLPWKKPEIPPKPESEEEQIDNLWDMCYNHIPTWMSALNWKVNTIMVLLAVIVGMIAFS